MSRSIKVAAVQLCAGVGTVAENLARAESLCHEAFRRGAQWVVLPEFFPSAMAFAPAMLSAWQPLESSALLLMRELARKYHGVVGGSFIAKSASDCFNSFLLVFPDGHYYQHDKDIPTMWENCYYIGGSDDGVLETPAGSIGVAMCWELIRSQTARRLLGRVDAVVGGSCWWDLRLPVPAKYVDEQTSLLDMLKQAPSQLARRLGVPVVHASHAGEFTGLTPGNESTPYRSRYLGETQIVDATGEVLSRLTYEDGEGVITADIALGAVHDGRAAIPNAYWTSELPPMAQKAWDHVNAFGREYYLKEVRPMLEGSH
jgi:predicted amidohydrolase